MCQYEGWGKGVVVTAQRMDHPTHTLIIFLLVQKHEIQSKQDKKIHIKTKFNSTHDT
jgi:hypothetical protein